MASGNSKKLNWKWQIALIFSLCLYYSGVIWVYEFIRKNIFKRYRRIILTYHRVHDGKKDPEISVSIRHFQEHVEYLARAFQVVALEELLLTTSFEINQDLVSITFDDGYADNYLYAFPILSAKRLPATIFLIADRIDQDKDMLGLDQIRIMQQKNISFGSHTCSHPVLSLVSLDQAQQEIKISKEKLEAMLGHEIYFFAYPKGKFAQYGPAVRNLVQQAGYRAALTMENSAVTDIEDPFEVKRLGIRDVPLFLFRTRISGIFESRLFLLIRRLFKSN